MIWRRRRFHLFPHELRLFKSETDAKPISTIALGPQTRLSEEYEESQVIGSFKLDSGGEEYFLFSDSGEEKALIIAGLGLACA